jgi:ABC-type multidrug transport system fused ATPase/permease subunit
MKYHIIFLIFTNIYGTKTLTMPITTKIPITQIMPKKIKVTNKKKISEEKKLWLSKNDYKKLTPWDFFNKKFFFLMFLSVLTSNFMFKFLDLIILRKIFEKFQNKVSLIYTAENIAGINIINFSWLLRSIIITIFMYSLKNINNFFFKKQINNIKEKHLPLIVYFIKKSKNSKNNNIKGWENFQLINIEIEKFGENVFNIVNAISFMIFSFWQINLRFYSFNGFKIKDFFKSFTLIMITGILGLLLIEYLFIDEAKNKKINDESLEILQRNKELFSSLDYYYVNNNYDIFKKHFIKSSQNFKLKNQQLFLDNIKQTCQDFFKYLWFFIILVCFVYKNIKNSAKDIKNNSWNLSDNKNFFKKLLKSYGYNESDINNNDVKNHIFQKELVQFFVQNMEFLASISLLFIESMKFYKNRRTISKTLSKFYFEKIQTNKPNNDSYENKIHFKNIKVNKPDSKDLILNIDDFVLNNNKNNEIIAIVGPSGSGKSTFINLLTKQEEDYDGEIFLENQDNKEILLEDIHIKNIANNFLILPQDSPIFSNSINDNITLGLPEDKEILDFIKNNYHLEFLNEKKSKGKTLITDKKLSGGEKQRVKIARLFYKDMYFKKYKKMIPNIILDEMDKGLDPILNMNNFKKIKNHFKDQRIFFITHKILNSMDADKIIVFDGGKIVEYGTPQELMEKNGYFKTLLDVELYSYFQSKI